MNPILVDTEVLSEFFRGNPTVITNFERYLQHYNVINFSVITHYEILNGLFYKDAMTQRQNFAAFSALNKVIPLTSYATELAAEIYSTLRKNGDLVSYTDSLIAGIAITENLQLATSNTALFKKIDRIGLQDWIHSLIQNG